MKNNRSWQTGCSFTVTENIPGHLPWFAAYDTYFKGAAFTLLLKYNKVLFLLCCKLFF